VVISGPGKHMIGMETGRQGNRPRTEAPCGPGRRPPDVALSRSRRKAQTTKISSYKYASRASEFPLLAVCTPDPTSRRLSVPCPCKSGSWTPHPRKYLPSVPSRLVSSRRDAHYYRGFYVLRHRITAQYSTLLYTPRRGNAPACRPRARAH
jgi:hypothetical protein